MMAEKYKNVTGVYMANWSATAKCTEADWNDVQRVCESVGIPSKRLSFEKDYWTEVFEPMIEMYKRGVTPNPDVNCNRYIKFGALYDALEKVHGTSGGKWWLATGHYARVGLHQQTGKVHLLRPKDLAKDQTYYLSSIDPRVMDRILFPLSEYTKPEVRSKALDYGLHTASKPDSQGLCFVSQEHRNFKDFLAEYLEPNKGNVVTEDGKVFGHHNGIWQATIGQRSSVSMPQGDPRYQGSWYVSEKRIGANELVIVRGRDNPRLFTTAADAEAFRWLCDLKEIDASTPEKYSVQFRSLQNAEHLTAIEVKEGAIAVQFRNPRRAVSPGQFLVLYEGDRILGSGVISRTTRCGDE
ncbi:mitochondrial tRNA-specific 2-thiouridylase 1 [Trichomonascus vanleenenianus]|uniref:tRNA-5-taurinomethyluridine 2-sulfurtransferase n=1 Tax=Trichomonascus vanleenenianus TaxID=2268995 RepID=UPI003ECB858F